jgi:hypothetical protein
MAKKSVAHLGISIDLDSQILRAGGRVINGDGEGEGADWLFDNLSPRQVFLLGQQLGAARGFQSGLEVAS